MYILRLELLHRSLSLMQAHAAKASAQYPESVKETRKDLERLFQRFCKPSHYHKIGHTDGGSGEEKYAAEDFLAVKTLKSGRLQVMMKHGTKCSKS